MTTSCGKPTPVLMGRGRGRGNFMQLSFLERPIWEQTKDGNPAAAQLYKKHYSCYQYKDNRRNNPAYRNRNLIVGPGEKLVLITPDLDAIFVWRKFVSKNNQTGVNCAVFRNESDHLSSYLIIEAMKIAWMKWPGERLYTYVNPKAIASRNPGYCFKMAGWKQCGITQVKKLIILEVYPNSVTSAPT